MKAKLAGMFIVLVAPRAAGKTTIGNNLKATIPGLKPLVSYTTRAPRPSDPPGEYSYLTVPEFNIKKNAGEFIWSGEIRGNFYGTRHEDLIAAKAASHPSLMIIVIKYVEVLMNFVGAENVVPIYIIGPDVKSLEGRVIKRGDTASVGTQEEINAELARARSCGYYYLVENIEDDPSAGKATRDIVKYINIEYKTAYMPVIV